MVKMRILTGTVAGGRPWAVGDIADLSKADADLLRVRGLAEDVEDKDAAEELPEVETATAEPSENAMRKPPKRRKARK